LSRRLIRSHRGHDRASAVCTRSSASAQSPVSSHAVRCSALPSLDELRKPFDLGVHGTSGQLDASINTTTQVLPKVHGKIVFSNIDRTSGPRG
jgi:hypothetical protein